jgi:hypothetical protein
VIRGQLEPKHDLGNYKDDAECPTTQPVPPARMVPPDARPFLFQFGDAPLPQSLKAWPIITMAWSRLPEPAPLRAAMLPR